MPRSVRVAVVLMFCGAVASLIVMVVTLATLDTLRAGLRERNTLSPELIDDIVTMAAVGSVGSLVRCGLWVWMALACKRGHHWARIVSTVFFGISVPTALFNLTFGLTLSGRLVGLLPSAIGAATIVLLWWRESRPYFRPDAGPTAWTVHGGP